MKKTVACLLAGVVCAGCFSGCTPFEKFSETFEGFLSEAVYTERGTALVAFCSAEIGENVSSTYQTERRLTKSEAEAEGICVPQGETFVAAEMGKVRVDGGEASLGTLQTNSGYRYYTPAPEKGERLSNSYLDSVFGAKKYGNCTVETTYSFRYSSIASNYYSIYEYTEDVVHMKQTLPGLLGLDAYFTNGASGIRTAMKQSDTEAYGKVPAGMEIYLKSGGVKRDIDSFSDVSEFSEFLYTLKFDARYLEKTAYGFRLPSENYKQLVLSLSSLTSEDTDIFDKVWNEMKMYACAEWYVSEGRLSRTKVTVNLVAEGSVVSVNVNSTYHKFGTTELVFPAVTEE